MKRLALAVAASVTVLGVLLWLVVSRGGVRGGFVDSAPLAEWLVALGTSGLAVATVLLAREARNEAVAVREEAEQVRRQVEVEAEQLVAAQRPLAIPVAGENNVDGMPQVTLKNAGVGPAMNVRGSLWWDGGASSLHPQLLPPGDTVQARVTAAGVAVDWSNAVGYLRYHDLGGAEWQTHFRFRTDGLGNVRVEVVAAGPTSKLGEPGYDAEGWQNRPVEVTLWQVSV
jgi:hypothetical protein